MIGMVMAVMGMLPPRLGAIAQEAIDLLAILNAARVVAVRRPLADYHEFVAPEPTTPALEAASEPLRRPAQRIRGNLTYVMDIRRGGRASLDDRRNRRPP